MFGGFDFLLKIIDEFVLEAVVGQLFGQNGGDVDGKVRLRGRRRW